MGIWGSIRTSGEALFSRSVGITATLTTLLMLQGCSLIEHRIGHQTLSLYAADPDFVLESPTSANGTASSGDTNSSNRAANGTGASGGKGKSSSKAKSTTNPDGTTAPIDLNNFNIIVCPASNTSDDSTPPTNAQNQPADAGGAQPPPKKSPSASDGASAQPKPAAAPQGAASTPSTAIPTSISSFGTANASSSSGNSGCEVENAYQAAIADESGGARNRLEAVLVGHSNLICSQIEAQIVGTNDLVNFTLGETTTVLAGSGALVTGATAAKLLAGLAAMTNATRSQVDEIFYENELKAAIIQKINELRAATLQTMATASVSSGKPVLLTVYSAEDMLNAVQTYHNLCSFYVGITSLTQTQAPLTAKK